MNINLVKEELKKHRNQMVEITVYGMRNKTNTFIGRIYNLYPNIFTILENNIEKSFNYRDIITKDIKIKYI